MEPATNYEDIVIVGAGLAGLSTALALHRLGIRSLVLESSESLRLTGFALTMWTNAWRALDAVGVGNILRDKSQQIRGFEVSSKSSSLSGKAPHKGDFRSDNFESRCLRRKDLLETFESELPKGAIRYSSKIVSIEESGYFKLVHLSDGSILRAKVLIGCDGVNSMVAKWLGLQDPVSAGRSAIRGFVVYPNGHGFEPKFHAYFGGGLRCGFMPCDDKSLYWFCTFNPSVFNYDENDNNPLTIKQFVLTNISNAPKHIQDMVERTTLDSIQCASLKLRLPWNILLGNIVKNNVCVAGDALHPMTPDIGQGGSSALEDSIVLARCLAESLLAKTDDNEDDYVKMERGLKKYENDRRWRSCSLITTSYLCGFIQECDGKVMSFLKKLILSKYTMWALINMGDFDCDKLVVS